METTAQVRPVYDQGAAGLGQLLKRLGNTKSVMHIGAHPDDEDSDLLAYLARAENARTVYLSLTRGDGGQNVIGPELFESLGVIRSEELLQARRLDGGEQLFTRAFDYGFSKRLDEAKAFWDENEIICDTVRAIRTVRPMVVISRFSGTPNDGHGQHQYAGYIAPKAVRAAADSGQCRDSGPAWQVLKFYVSQGFRDQSEPGLRVNTGNYDFLIGRSYYEIAAEGRSQHKTQEQGGLELKGERFAGMNLVESRVLGTEEGKSVFDGIDTSISGIPKLIGVSGGDLVKNTAETQRLAEEALQKCDLLAPQLIVPILKAGLAAAYKAKWSTRDPKAKFLLEQKEHEFTEAIKRASGIQIDALANLETAIRGESILSSVRVFYPETADIKVKEIKLNTPEGWEISPGSEQASNSPFARFFRENPRESKTFSVKVGINTKYTQPYFMEREKENYLYQWPADGNQNKPFQGPLMSADVTVEIAGTTITFNQPIEFRYADDTRGEIRRNVNIVPRLSLEPDQNLLVFPQSDKEQIRKLILGVRNNSPGPISGTARLNLPDGWKTASAGFELKNKGDKTSVAFDITVPAGYKVGNFAISAEVVANGETYTQTMNEIAYPHIQTHRFYTDANTRAEIIDLRVAGVRVGYIMGSGDSGPEAIRQMGLEVRLLNESDLTNSNFEDFDVIIVGIRASEVRPDYVANNQRLLEYVRNGGTLIVQYQKNAYLNQNLAPFPAQLNARVAEEDAKITILEPMHPVFNFPNRITDSDWDGWVQERNLYSFTSFDSRYTPLLESHDTGEPENKGGMLYAEIGEGKFVYTTYAFFRQLPAGVPGAYRLFANLLSLPKAK